MSTVRDRVAKLVGSEAAADASWAALAAWVGELSSVSPEDREEWLSWGISPSAMDLYEVRQEQLIEDLVPLGQKALLIAPAGGGKSTMTWQLFAQASCGEDAFGHFVVPTPLRVMIVDFEQSVQDARVIRDTMKSWQLDTSRMIWLPARDRPLDRRDNQEWLLDRVRYHRPQMIALDTATDSVMKPRDDESVRPMMNFLDGLLANEGVGAIWLLAHLRKRPSGPVDERTFDDLFGSVLWQMRPSAAFYLDDGSITVWKQRGDLLRHRWGKPAGQPFTVGQVVRSDERPTLIGPMNESLDDRRETEIVRVIEEEPNMWSATSLVEERLKVPFSQRGAWKAAIARLLKDEVLVTDGQYKKLRRV